LLTLKEVLDGLTSFLLHLGIMLTAGKLPRSLGLLLCLTCDDFDRLSRDFDTIRILFLGEETFPKTLIPVGIFQFYWDLLFLAELLRPWDWRRFSCLSLERRS